MIKLTIIDINSHYVIYKFIYLEAYMILYKVQRKFQIVSVLMSNFTL